MQFPGRTRTLVSALALLLLAAAAQATVVLRLSVEDMGSLCDRAVLGRVVETRVDEDSSNGALWTAHRVRVEESWVGAGAEDVIVCVPGGTARGVTQDFHGGARLTKDGRVALLLWRDAAGRLQVLGEAQGAFEVTTDPASGTETCSNSVEGLAFVDRAGKRAEQGVTRLSLGDLRRRIADGRAQREERDRLVREARERRAAVRRERARRLAVLLRGRPGAPVAD